MQPSDQTNGFNMVKPQARLREFIPIEMTIAREVQRYLDDMRLAAAYLSVTFRVTANLDDLCRQRPQHHYKDVLSVE
ncbi:hypothetical protein [Microvirga rosea]|uniref:hypothetical protein n=1 Tax=Microvirga rosea TaxID=2715425 RepID=UPI001D0AA13A|nr:hypothetical protein [Microvirga rosea]MCB8820604.1 hypothetical protein [Microvirga rosea]